MKKLNNKKGFTLAELLIVVAIIGVLIAIALPTFKGQLDAAKVAADISNIRSAYSQAVATALTNANPDTSSISFADPTTNKPAIAINNTAHTVTVTIGSASDSFKFSDDTTLTITSVTGGATITTTP